MLMFSVLCSSAAITYAYLTDSEEVQNHAGIADNTVHIEEEFEPPAEIDPGTVIKKSPKLVNDSEVPVYVRMSARFSTDQAEAFCEPLVINGGWSYGTDGYYYYDQVLKPGDSTAALFEKVEIREDVSSDALVPFDLLIYAESVQADEGTMDDAWAFFERSSL